MNARWALSIMLLIPLSFVMFIGFDAQPKVVAQSERINVVELAARVVELEEENVNLEARVAELERVVGELLAGDEVEQPTPTSDRHRTTGTPQATVAPEMPTETPAAELTVEPILTVTPAAEAALPSLDDIEIDWRGLSEYFEITNIRFELEQVTDSAGRLTDVPVLAFDVEAKTSFLLGVFFANFYDADDTQMLFFSFVEFMPDYMGSWLPGMRSRGHIRLPEMSDVASIRFKKL